MLKPNLNKAVMLGLGIAAFSTSLAFAQVRSTEIAPEFRGEIAAEGSIELYDKQKEIDLYLFADHVDEISDKGIKVAYTGVMGDVVEIGITPFTDENADYLYGIFGNNEVRVVEAADNIIYADSTNAAVSDLITGTAIDGSDIMLPDGAVSLAGAAVNGEGSQESEGNVAADSDAVTNEELMYTTGIADTAADTGSAVDGDEAVSSDEDIKVQLASSNAGAADDIRTVAAESQTASQNDKDTGSNSVDSSVIILAIAGGAVLVGGGILAAKRKKTDK
jgi:LPXTG-motif cell wall-anchored protein